MAKNKYIIDEMSFKFKGKIYNHGDLIELDDSETEPFEGFIVEASEAKKGRKPVNLTNLESEIKDLRGKLVVAEDEITRYRDLYNEALDAIALIQSVDASESESESEFEQVQEEN